MIRKKTLAFLSLGGVLFFLVFLFANELGLCPLVNQSCVQTFDPIAEILSVFIPLFLLSLITYKMRDEVYRAWVRFAQWWVPLSILAVFFSPEYADSFGIALYPITKGSVVFISSLLFTLISFVIITWKYIATRHNRN